MSHTYLTSHITYIKIWEYGNRKYIWSRRETYISHIGDFPLPRSMTPEGIHIYLHLYMITYHRHITSHTLEYDDMISWNIYLIHKRHNLYHHMYPLVNKHSYWKWPLIVDVPLKMVIFHSYVKLPEGMRYPCFLGIPIAGSAGPQVANGIAEGWASRAAKEGTSDLDVWNNASWFLTPENLEFGWTRSHLNDDLIVI